MKKLMTVILSVCALVLLCGGSAFAYDDDYEQFDEDTGLFYIVEGDEVTITGYDEEAIINILVFCIWSRFLYASFLSLFKLSNI